MNAARTVLKTETWNSMGSACVICGNPATDLDECFIPKSAVMGRAKTERLSINNILNCAPLCNPCNTNVTHKGRVVERQAKLLSTGMEAVTEWGFKPGDYDDGTLMDIGAMITQAWVISMQMKTRYDIRAMADL